MRFYDNEIIGDKNIRNIILDDKTLYEFNWTKKGETQTKENIKYLKVKIEKFDEKKQFVQIVGYASYKGNEEIFVYNGFSIKYEKNVENRDFEFWVILFAFVGVIIIKLLLNLELCMYIYMLKWNLEEELL